MAARGRYGGHRLKATEPNMSARLFYRLLPAMGVLLMLCSAAHADSLVLKSGGELRGKFEAAANARKDAPDGRPERYVIRTLAGTLVSVESADVAQVIVRRPLLEEYETLRRTTPDTVERQWNLAEWCREHSLSQARATHLERVVALDPLHVAAHRGLGHVKHEGRWTTRDEIMTSRGYVKHKGKYVLPQELELIEEEERANEAEKVWFRKVKMWRGWLAGDRAPQALQELRAIRDPDAAAAVARTFRNDPAEPLRLMMVEILTQIEGEPPLAALVKQSLYDDAPAVRSAAVRGVRNRNITPALPVYLKALKHESNEYVNRAAWALGQFDDQTVVPYLIEALVTTHRYRIEVPDPNVVSMNADGSMTTSGVPLPPNVELLLRTGQLPYGVGISGLSIPMKQVTVEQQEKNPVVLAALADLTGEDLGFDEQAWREWYRGKLSGAVRPKTGRP